MEWKGKNGVSRCDGLDVLVFGVERCFGVGKVALGFGIELCSSGKR